MSLATVMLAGPVEGLDGVVATGPCVLGQQPASGEERSLVLGAGVVIRSFAVVYGGSVLEARVQVGHGALVREDNLIGADVSIGSGAQLEPGNRIGARSRIHSGCFLSSTTIGEDVFCGPRVVFTDDPHPPCPRYAECVGGAVVGIGASIGAGSVILPGVHIGAGALVGAGSTVTRNVPDGSVVVGNPARVTGARDELECFAGLFPRAYDRTARPSR